MVNWFKGLVSAAIVIAPHQATAQNDLAGSWAKPNFEDHVENPEIGDFTGLPINEAARIKANTWDPERWGVPEHQCEPHPITYAFVGPANLRIWPEAHPQTQQIIAWRMTIQWMMPTRTIWMDGRPHPPEWAPHTWMGFSTGRWEGDTLVVTTTHIKAGWLRRNGVPLSDKAVMREHFIRRGNVLTVASAIDDPIYLTEPLLRTINWEIAPGYSIGSYPCDVTVEVPRPDGFVPFYLPGQNKYLTDWAAKTGLPLEAARGGAETTRPEYRRRLTSTREGR